MPSLLSRPVFCRLSSRQVYLRRAELDKLTEQLAELREVLKTKEAEAVRTSIHEYFHPLVNPHNRGMVFLGLVVIAYGATG